MNIRYISVTSSRQAGNDRPLPGENDDLHLRTRIFLQERMPEKTGTSGYYYFISIHGKAFSTGYFIATAAPENPRYF
jgi:hypothetical protein